MSWFLLKNRRHQGPYSLEQLKEAYTGGRATARDYCILEEHLKGNRFEYVALREIIPIAEVPAPVQKKEPSKSSISIDQIKIESHAIPTPEYDNFAESVDKESSIHFFEAVDARDFVLGPSSETRDTLPLEVSGSSSEALLAGAQKSPPPFLQRVDSALIKRLGFALAGVFAVVFLWPEISKRLPQSSQRSAAKRDVGAVTGAETGSARARPKSARPSVTLPADSLRRQDALDAAARVPRPSRMPLPPKESPARDGAAHSSPPPSESSAGYEGDHPGPVSEEPPPPSESEGANSNVNAEPPSDTNDDRVPQSATIQQEEVVP